MVYAYCRLCLNQSDQQLRETLGKLVILGGQADDPLMGEALRRFAQRALDEYEATGAGRSVASFLPIPDIGKGGQTYWMLPELTSLTGIYGRLNRYYSGDVSSIALVHDEHAHFDDIFHLAKKAAEELAEQGFELTLRHSDYRFRERASLRFGRSRDEPGIQVADVLAGFAMRYIQERLASPKLPTDGREEIFVELLKFSAPLLPTGVNFVMAETDLIWLGIPYS